MLDIGESIPKMLPGFQHLWLVSSNQQLCFLDKETNNFIAIVFIPDKSLPLSELYITFAQRVIIMGIEFWDVILVCIFAFTAGFVDAIVGGGGLIQTPAILVLFPAFPVPMLLGTTKIPSFSGTLNATVQYSRKIKMQWKLLAGMCPIAFAAAYFGSSSVSNFPKEWLRPILLVLMILIAIYTFINKNFGTATTETAITPRKYSWAFVWAAIIGFYDGFFGPGTGSFLILVAISLLGMGFLPASAHAKAINLFTNMASIIYFGSQGLIIWKITFPMAICNFCGGFLGAKLAIRKGNHLVRYFFLAIVCATILRFAYDIFILHH